MAGFHYEKNLPHQMVAVQAVLSVFDRAEPSSNERGENPSLMLSEHQYKDNIRTLQQANQIETIFSDGSQVLDIAMETGTGKTYTYTQTMYELQRQCGVYKFVIAVPTLSIKAGTEQFLKSEALRNHFRLDFDGRYGDSEIELYVVQSQKTKKSKKQTIPSEIVRFVEADNTNKIHVLLLNMGMINSPTMRGEDSGNDGSVLLKDLYSKPFEAIASVKPFLIIDEPHRFKDDNKTWQSLMAFAPQFILRYGATFNDKFRNLIYRLTAIDAFNQDLVKGVRAFIEAVQGDNHASIKFIEKLSENEARFELSTKEGRTSFTLAIGENLNKVHPAIDDLILTKIHQRKSLVVFNETIEIELNGSIKPYSYSNQITDKMLRQAVREHFKAEKTLLSRADKIKPLTLFFIDDIAGYRDGKAQADSLLQRFEACVKDEAQKALQTAEIGSAFYHSLQTVLADVSASHGGYFSKDNASDDEKIAKEINEILHDKESLLSLDNPRRFIFSKWTLREGWDNPNVFGICKLRSSGSETSKLQEVGRGLRLPVNEFMARVKDGDFKLNYFVDSSEADFVEKLTAEVNSNVQKAPVFTQFNDELFAQIQAVYPEVKKRALGNTFHENGWIDDDDNFVGNGFEQVKKAYPNAFGKPESLKKGKITTAGKDKNTVKMRVGKYEELKALWETINQKAILRYPISEAAYEQLLVNYLLASRKHFTQTGIRTKVQALKVNQGLLYAEDDVYRDDDFDAIVTMDYRTFLEKLAQQALIQRRTLHRAFHRVREQGIVIEKFMNAQTIVAIHTGFNRYLLHHSFSQFQVGYHRIDSAVHPTAFTDQQGKPLDEVNAANLGVKSEEYSPLESFLFDSVVFDSEIERQNIVEGAVNAITVFTKIPKNAIKIPVAGGGSYSPDFAYIVKTAKGDILNLVVESKGLEGSDELRHSELQKIKHAEQWFKHVGGHIAVKFMTQFEGEKIQQIIRKALG
ncbi:restriction endonuclease subunit R [Pasteurellaceae bacterium Orientalotternb1]|nr:restriction endonuclease subunit R [Pasteurellaceae bacterium Orientalotternb1]